MRQSCMLSIFILLIIFAIGYLSNDLNVQMIFFRFGCYWSIGCFIGLLIASVMFD